MGFDPKEYEFPYWRYHKEHEPRIVKNEADLEALPGGIEEWHDNPTDAGVKMELHSTSGGHQQMRRVKDYVPEALKSNEELDAEASSESQKVEVQPEEDISEASDERLREILVGHGYPKDKLDKKSRKQLLKMLSE